LSCAFFDEGVMKNAPAKKMVAKKNAAVKKKVAKSSHLHKE